MERRLAAILAADVVGYSRLMGADEAGTLQRLTELRQRVLEPLIGEHHGRVVKLMGDGLLVKFPSLVDAATCAVAWQNQVAEDDTTADDTHRLRFRIGINLGDVIVDGEDIHGDGVNIASRLEGMACAGGICLSADAYRQVRGKIGAAFKVLGKRKLKNIADPIHVYSITTGVGEAGYMGQISVHPALPDKPSIAVLPFDNMSALPDQDFLADGISEDIITALSKLHSLFVIARNSSFAFRGQQLDVREVGKRLGVRYLVEGSVRRSGDRARITAQLVDAVEDKHIWAERYDRGLADIFFRSG